MKIFKKEKVAATMAKLKSNAKPKPTKAPAAKKTPATTRPIIRKTVDPKLAKLEQSEARLKADKYHAVTPSGAIIRNHRLKREDAANVKELNAIRAQKCHESAGMASGAWLSPAAIKSQYGVIPATLHRLYNEGHLLRKRTGNDFLFSVPTLEKFLNDSPLN